MELLKWILSVFGSLIRLGQSLKSPLAIEYDPDKDMFNLTSILSDETGFQAFTLHRVRVRNKRKRKTISNVRLVLDDIHPGTNDIYGDIINRTERLLIKKRFMVSKDGTGTSDLAWEGSEPFDIVTAIHKSSLGEGEDGSYHLQFENKEIKALHQADYTITLRAEGDDVKSTSRTFYIHRNGRVILDPVEDN